MRAEVRAYAWAIVAVGFGLTVVDLLAVNYWGHRRQRDSGDCHRAALPAGRQHAGGLRRSADVCSATWTTRHQGSVQRSSRDARGWRRGPPFHIARWTRARDEW